MVSNMDTEMTDSSVDVTVPAAAPAVGANHTASDNGEPGPTSSKRKRITAPKMFQLTPSGELEEIPEGTAEYERCRILDTMRQTIQNNFDPARSGCERNPCFAPNVALEEVYEQMKLEIESFSNWWKKLFPVGTNEEYIQRAFEIYRVNVTQADLEKVFDKHADHIPFTLADDLEVKRKELIDKALQLKMTVSDSSVDGFVKFMLGCSDGLRRQVLQTFIDKGGPNEQELRDMLDKPKEEMTPGNLAALRSVFKQDQEKALTDAQVALRNFGEEYIFWHTMSQSQSRRPLFVIIGAGAVDPGARDTPDEKAFQLPEDAYLEQARLGFESFKAWAKKQFAAAAHPRFDDDAIEALFDIFKYEIAEKNAESIKDKMEMRAKIMEAQERWRAAIGVPLNFDDRRKELLSKVKEAKYRASAGNIEKRSHCYTADIDKKIDLYDRLIARLREEEEDHDEDDEEIHAAYPCPSLEIEELEALVKKENVKWFSKSQTESIWKEEALKRLDGAREDLKKHLNSITRRQYLYSTIKGKMGNKLLEQAIPNEDVLEKVSLKLKPYQIKNFQAAVKVARDNKKVTAVWKKKMARLAADTKQPLSEGAEFFFDNLTSSYMSDIYLHMEAYTESIAEQTGKKLHLVDAVFDVNYFEGDEDREPHFRFYVHALVKEEVDESSEYKKWAAEGRKRTTKRRHERCSGQYHVIGGEQSCIYFADGDGFNEAEEEFEDFLDSFYSYEKWSTSSQWDLPFSVGPDGTVTQRKFVETADGRSTFPLMDGEPYNPIEHPMSFDEPTTEW